MANKPKKGKKASSGKKYFGQTKGQLAGNAAMATLGPIGIAYAAQNSIRASQKRPAADSYGKTAQVLGGLGLIGTPAAAGQAIHAARVMKAAGSPLSFKSKAGMAAKIAAGAAGSYAMLKEGTRRRRARAARGGYR